MDFSRNVNARCNALAGMNYSEWNAKKNPDTGCQGIGFNQL